MWGKEAEEQSIPEAVDIRAKKNEAGEQENKEGPGLLLIREVTYLYVMEMAQKSRNVTDSGDGVNR